MYRFRARASTGWRSDWLCGTATGLLLMNCCCGQSAAWITASANSRNERKRVRCLLTESCLRIDSCSKRTIKQAPSVNGFRSKQIECQHRSGNPRGDPPSQTQEDESAFISFFSSVMAWSQSRNFNFPSSTRRFRSRKTSLCQSGDGKSSSRRDRSADSLSISSSFSPRFIWSSGRSTDTLYSQFRCP